MCRGVAGLWVNFKKLLVWDYEVWVFERVGERFTSVLLYVFSAFLSNFFKNPYVSSCERLL